MIKLNCQLWKLLPHRQSSLLFPIVFEFRSMTFFQSWIFTWSNRQERQLNEKKSREQRLHSRERNIFDARLTKRNNWELPPSSQGAIDQSRDSTLNEKSLSVSIYCIASVAYEYNLSFRGWWLMNLLRSDTLLIVSSRKNLS